MFRKLFKNSPARPQQPLSGVITNPGQFCAHYGISFDPEDWKRQEWFSNRLWHNGPHANCCKKCLQAGYVLALVRANRIDLLGEFPELIKVYEELRDAGMLRPLMAHQ